MTLVKKYLTLYINKICGSFIVDVVVNAELVKAQIVVVLPHKLKRSKKTS